MEEFAEAGWDDEPIVTYEVTVTNGISIVTRDVLPRARFFQKYRTFFGIDHLRNLQVPDKSYLWR